MKTNIFQLTAFNPRFNAYLPYTLEYEVIYQSEGLIRHIEKRHPEALPYIKEIRRIIEDPDYIGVNPNEKGTSFELIKKIDENIQIGIKLDVKEDYLYVATLHTVTSGKIRHGLENGRLKKFDSA